MRNNIYNKENFISVIGDDFFIKLIFIFVISTIFGNLIANITSLFFLIPYIEMLLKRNGIKRPVFFSIKPTKYSNLIFIISIFFITICFTLKKMNIVNKDIIFYTSLSFYLLIFIDILFAYYKNSVSIMKSFQFLTNSREHSPIIHNNYYEDKTMYNDLNLSYNFGKRIFCFVTNNLIVDEKNIKINNTFIDRERFEDSFERLYSGKNISEINNDEAIILEMYCY